MKKILVLATLTLALFTSLSTLHAQPIDLSSVRVDRSASEFLGKTMLRFIDHADSVVLLRINPVPGAAGQERYKGFPIMGRTTRLTPLALYVLHSTLKKRQYYQRDEIHKSCPMRPDYVVLFYGERNSQLDSLSVAISLQCATWAFTLGEVEKLEDIDPYTQIIGATLNYLYCSNRKETTISK